MLRIAIMITIIAVLLPGHAQSQNKSELKSKHGNWELRCGEACFLMQAAKRGNMTLTMIVVKTKDGKSSLRVIAPLGVLLVSDNQDLGMKVDGTDLGSSGFVRCLARTGCVSERSVTADILDKLKAGNVATYSIRTAPQKVVEFPVSLIGFTAGYNALP